MNYVWIYLALVNVIGFFLMKHDKEQSRRSRWRVSERRLFTYAAVGGALGVWAGMLAFRHKTKHMSFVLGVPALAVVNAVCLYLILTRLADS
ncbi:DUF1294 domain-containing protein [Paenibacillus antri]|uniref:DUF1294 domain-containing protein n=1 Tax=Paenibacillus antri TaxID=2582848 RepID=A0A5R9GF36_9BACL|nr:DUF1294 domain-containing protein [Paenibacillus antri]TLS51293.1 DUF1294 domain-containing protein [Paenibacillus antri]